MPDDAASRSPTAVRLGQLLLLVLCLNGLLCPCPADASHDTGETQQVSDHGSHAPGQTGCADQCRHHDREVVAVKSERAAKHAGFGGQPDDLKAPPITASVQHPATFDTAKAFRPLITRTPPSPSPVHLKDLLRE